jgi:hypothetical protein
MSTYPEIQQALVAAARTRYGRRPRAIRVVRRVAVVAGCVAVSAGVVTLAGGGTSDEIEAPSGAAQPATHDPVSDDYAVFKRPETQADALPNTASVTELLRQDPARSRLIVTDGSWRVFLVDGRALDAPQGAESTSLCAIVFVGEALKRGACFPPGQIAGGEVPNMSFAPRDGMQGAVLAIVPDGANEVKVTFADKSTRQLQVRDNIAFYRPLSRLPVTMEWSNADGKSVVSQAVSR